MKNRINCCLKYIYYSTCLDVMISVSMYVLAVIACLILVIILPIASLYDFIRTGKWGNPFQPTGGEFEEPYWYPGEK